MRVLFLTFTSLALLLAPRLGAAQASFRISRLALPLQRPGLACPTSVRVQVTDQARFRQWQQQQMPGARALPIANQPTLLTLERLPTNGLQKLAACPWVRFVDQSNRRAHEEASVVSADLTLNTLAAVWYVFPSLTGEGLTASVKEQAFDTTDIDLRGRAVPFSLDGRNITSHATEMATFIAGAGNTGPLGRGAASHARVASANFDNLLPDDTAVLQREGVSVQNHSYGIAIENYYGLDAVAYDEQTQQLPSLLHVFSSGNSGDQTSTEGPYAGLAGVATLTGQIKQSKNTLSVGATNAISELRPRSSRGPAYDGRLKPELVAYGAGGSSDAAALVSGAALLVQDAYRTQYAGMLPPAALVKAALLNATNDIGTAGPDFATGFGELDALGAVQTIAERRLLEGSVANLTQRTFTLAVPAGAQELKLTLAWHDLPAAANASQALINDLDVELVAVSSGQRWRPWVLSTTPRADSLALPARRGPDHLNNVEQITVAAPAPGQYQVVVKGYAVPSGSQAFYVAYETTAQGLQWTWPMAGSVVEATQPNYVRWHWTGPATTATLQFRFAGAPQWQTIANNVSVQAGYYAWAPPDTAAAVQLRLQLNGKNEESGQFLIGPDPKLRTVYYCPPQALLAWRAVPGVEQYQLYTLRGRYLEPLRTTTDTMLRPADNDMTPYYAVAPLVQGQPSYRSLTLNYQKGTACYIVSFLPRQLVDAVQSFDVQLASTYQLGSATLERQDAGGYVALQTISPVTATSLQFTDASPLQGSSLYRIRLVTATGATFFSQPERVYYLPEKEVAVFPNPLHTGEFIRVAVTGAPVLQLRLFDSLGRLLRHETADGVINELSTRGLKPGSYLLRVEATDGRRWTRHISLH